MKHGKQFKQFKKYSVVIDTHNKIFTPGLTFWLVPQMAFDELSVLFVYNIQGGEALRFS